MIKTILMLFVGLLLIGRGTLLMGQPPLHSTIVAIDNGKSVTIANVVILKPLKFGNSNSISIQPLTPFRQYIDRVQVNGPDPKFFRFDNLFLTCNSWDIHYPESNKEYSLDISFFLFENAPDSIKRLLGNFRSFIIKVPVESNKAPEFVSVPVRIAFDRPAGQPVNLDFLLSDRGVVNDPDGPKISYGTKTNPYNFSLTENGKLSGTIKAATTASDLETNPLEITYSDGVNPKLAAKIVFVPTLVPLPPYFNRQPNQSLEFRLEGRAFAEYEVCEIDIFAIDPATNNPANTQIQFFSDLAGLRYETDNRRILFTPGDIVTPKNDVFRDIEIKFLARLSTAAVGTSQTPEHKILLRVFNRPTAEAKSKRAEVFKDFVNEENKLLEAFRPALCIYTSSVIKSTGKNVGVFVASGIADGSSLIPNPIAAQIVKFIAALGAESIKALSENDKERLKAIKDIIENTAKRAESSEKDFLEGLKKLDNIPGYTESDVESFLSKALTDLRSVNATLGTLDGVQPYGSCVFCGNWKDQTIKTCRPTQSR